VSRWVVLGGARFFVVLVLVVSSTPFSFVVADKYPSQKHIETRSHSGFDSCFKMFTDFPSWMSLAIFALPVQLAVLYWFHLRLTLRATVPPIVSLEEQPITDSARPGPPSRHRFSAPSASYDEEEKVKSNSSTSPSPAHPASPPTEVLSLLMQQLATKDQQVVELYRALTQHQHQQQQSNASFPTAVVSPPRNHLPVRLPALSKFNGEIGAALEVWRRELESHFDYYSRSSIINDDDRLQYAVAHLGDAARTWWESIKGTEEIKTYAAFKESLFARYRPILASEQARTQLWSLQQREKQSVSGYINTFQSLMAHISDMGEADQVHQFVRGLNSQVGQRVREQTPTKLAAAIALAVKYEGSLSLGTKAAASYRATTASSHTDNDQMDLGAVAASENTTAPAPAPSHTPSLEDVMSQLNALNARFAQSSASPPSSVPSFPTTQPKASGRPRGGRGGRFKIEGVSREDIVARKAANQCFKCGGSGHWKSECTKK